MRKMGEKGLRLLILSGLALLAVSTAANAVEPECLPANICGYSYYVIQEMVTYCVGVIIRLILIRMRKFS